MARHMCELDDEIVSLVRSVSQLDNAQIEVNGVRFSLFLASESIDELEEEISSRWCVDNPDIHEFPALMLRVQCVDNEVNHAFSHTRKIVEYDVRERKMLVTGWLRHTPIGGMLKDDVLDLVSHEVQEPWFWMWTRRGIAWSMLSSTLLRARGPKTKPLNSFPVAHLNEMDEVPPTIDLCRCDTRIARIRRGVYLQTGIEVVMDGDQLRLKSFARETDREFGAFKYDVRHKTIKVETNSLVKPIKESSTTIPFMQLLRDVQNGRRIDDALGQATAEYAKCYNEAFEVIDG